MASQRRNTHFIRSKRNSRCVRTLRVQVSRPFPCEAVSTAAHVHDLTPAADLLHGEETVVYADAGYQGIEKRDEMQGRGIGFRVAMRPGKRRVLPDTPEGRLDDLVETAKAHIRAKVEHPFRVI